MANAIARRPFDELGDQQLLDQTQRLVANKRALEVHILDHLAEIDRRGLALRRGFSSLFDYAVRELGFSDASAQRRIQTMRLARRHEWVRAELQSGDLNLTSAAQLETAFAGAERQWRQRSRQGGVRQRDRDGQSPDSRPQEIRGADAVARGSDAAAPAVVSAPAPGPAATSASADAAEAPGTAECKRPAMPAAAGTARHRDAAPTLAESVPAAMSATGAVTKDEPDAAKCLPPAVPSGDSAHHRDVAAALTESVPVAMSATAAVTKDESDAAKCPPPAMPSGAAAHYRDAAPAPAESVPAAMPATGVVARDEPEAAASPPTTPSLGTGNDRVTALPAAPAHADTASSGVSASGVVATSEPVAVDCVASVPLIDPRRQRELIRQAAGLSTRQVAGLIADAAGPGTAQPRDTLRTVGNGRYTLKVSIDEECERGLRQLKGLLSHLDPRMSWGDLVARLVREAVERHDPRRGGRGRRRRVSSAGETRRREQEEVQLPGRTAESGGDRPTPAPKCTKLNSARCPDPATSAPAGASDRPQALHPPSASPTGDAPAAAAADTPAPEFASGMSFGRACPAPGGPDRQQATHLPSASPGGDPLPAGPTTAISAPQRTTAGAARRLEPAVITPTATQGQPVAHHLPAPARGHATEPDASRATSAPQAEPGTAPAGARPDSAVPPRPAPASAPETSCGAETGERPVNGTAQSVKVVTPAPENDIGTRRRHGNSALAPRADTPAAHSDLGTSVDGRRTCAETATDAAGHAAGPRRRAARRRAIPAAVRRLVWERDQGRCCYRDPLTGRRCNSSHLLQIDHVLPVAQGGGADPANLRLACFAHHRLRHRNGLLPQPEPQTTLPIAG